jgi:hypothetical protein
MAHVYNPSYSGGTDQENHSLKPALGEQLVRLLSGKYPTQYRAGGVAQVVECLLASTRA